MMVRKRTLSEQGPQLTLSSLTGPRLAGLDGGSVLDCQADATPHANCRGVVLIGVVNDVWVSALQLLDGQVPFQFLAVLRVQEVCFRKIHD